MARKVVGGPGTVRVGRFIGRLGVVSLPAVQAGLGLDERVVRRHVARLEAAGWLERAPWVWGEGSAVWLTGAGIEAAGPSGVRAVKTPPATATIMHGVQVGWSAARVERRGRVWKSARELAVEHDRWAIPIRCERGQTKQLPDLAVWLKRGSRPIALIVERGRRREDRQKLILEGWRDAIWNGRYAGVYYDCASASVAQLITRLAKKVALTGPALTAAVQLSAEEIAALPPVDDVHAAAGKPTVAPSVEPAEVDQVAGASVGPRPEPERARAAPHAPKRDPNTETAEEAAERERRYREILGIPEPKPRLRWRRSA